ncbi:MAG: hypothetical protein VXW43_00505 [Pseudomonadota bacterium]|nr:hypothetical protein [Pseudomonadota bacterium]
MPNTLAYIVVFSYPLVVLLLFRKLSLPKALIWSILGGYLFLPEKTGIDLPVLPVLDKSTIPALSAAVMVWLKRERSDPVKARQERSEEPGRTAGRPVRVRRQGGRLMLLLLIIGTVAPFATYYVNREPVIWGAKYIPAMTIYDSFSMVLATFMAFIPFLLARRQLASSETHREILKSLVWAGVVCSLLIFVEVRLSPQMNRWIYGFFPHSFAQHIRGGGFRPILFLEHGLRVGIFMSMVALASCGLFGLREGKRPGFWLFLAGWFIIALFLSKNFGAFVITLLLLPVALLPVQRPKVIIAAFLASIVLMYPIARGGGIIPLDAITSAAYRISEDRAESLVYRLDNEGALLERANEKPFFGWGMWYRNGVFDENGKRISVTDGIWVIIIGIRGWAGYIGFFGILTLPIVLLAYRSRQLSIDRATVGLMLVLVANLVDLLPNSSLVPITWLIAGALAGRYEQGRQVANVEREGSSSRRRTIKRKSPGGRRSHA